MTLEILTGPRGKILKQSEEKLQKLFKSSPDLGFERFAGENPEEEIEHIKSLAESQSLFGNKTAVVIDETEELAPLLAEILPGLERSDNAFILRRTEEVPGKKFEFNIFSFTDAVAARKKKDAWILYQKALAAGMAAEQVYYSLFGEVRKLLLAEKSKTAEEAGIHPYPYSKAKASLKNFRPFELERLSESLVVGYHRARRGQGEIETLVEKTLLKL